MVHFPRRAPKSVGEKWIKTLDPALSYRPFTAEEDQLLHNSSNEGAVLKRRSHQSVKRRWTELADEQTIAASCEKRLIKRAFKRGRATGKKKTSLSSKDLMIVPRSK